MDESDTERQLRSWFLAEPSLAVPARLRERVTAIRPTEGTRRFAGVLGLAGWQAQSLRGPIGHSAIPGRSGVRAPVVWLVLVGLLLVALVAIVALGVGSAPSSVSPFTGAIAFARGGNLYVSAADGRDLVEIVGGSDDGYVRAIGWSPDHSRLAFVRDTDTGSELLIVAPDGRSLGSFGDDATHSLHFGWAPDGQRLAISSSDRRDAVAIVGLDGRLLDSIALPEAFRVNTGERGGVSWSPDGAWIAVAACTTCGKTDSNTLLLEADGSGSRWLTEGPGTYNADDLYLAWGPDSQLAVTQYCPPGHGDVCRDQSVAIFVPPASSHRQVALPEGLHPAEKAWSPDGTRLAVRAFGYETAPYSRLFIIEQDGTSHIVATGDDMDPSYVGWAADGQSMLLVAGSITDDGASLWKLDLAGGPPSLLIEDVDSFDIDGPP